MAHSNSFPTLITVSQQLNQAHFQQTASSQMQHTALVNSQILFPQCQQTLSLQSAQNGAMTPNAQMNNTNGTNKPIQHNRQFQQQQQQQQHLTIPVQLGAGNHAFTTAGIPLDLSYFVQGGCLPNCLPIQLTGPGGLQQGFQAALNCVSSGNTGIDPQQQQQVSQQQQQQQQQTDQSSTPGNSFLQFNVAYQPQHGLLPAFQTVMQQQPQQQQQQQQQQASTSTAGTGTVSSDHSVVLTGKTGPAKRKKRPAASLGTLGLVATGNCIGGNKSDKPGVLGSLGNLTGLGGERFHSVAVQTDFDMTLCRQQIVVVPPKNCTCGAVAQAMASGAFQAASFPPGPRKPDKKVRRSYSGKQELLGGSGDMLKDEQQLNHEHGEQDVPDSPPEHDSSLPGDHMQQQCNGASGVPASSASAPPPCAAALPNCDNRGRPFSYECLYCPKRFSLHSRLVAHLRCHTGMRPFSCLQCGYSFTQRSYLNRHAAVHKQERPFSCLACHKTYKHYGSLANHRKLHSKEAGPGGGGHCGGGTDPSELTGDTTSGPSVQASTGGQHVFQQQQAPMLQASLYQTSHDPSGSFLVALSQPTGAPGTAGGAGLVSGTQGSMLLLHPGSGPSNPAGGNNSHNAQPPPHTSSAPGSGVPTNYVPIIMSSASFS